MMKLAALALAAVAATASAAAPLKTVDTPIEGKYIVVFKPESTAEQRAAHMDLVKAAASTDKAFNVEYTYSMVNFHGYAGPMSDATVDAVRADDATVAYVEQDGVVSIDAPIKENVVLDPMVNASVSGAAACQSQVEATWGIVRTGERERSIDGIYTYDDNELGQGVDAYIIDTGIYTDHSEFEGRAIFGYDSTNPTNPNQGDGNGHGTHVAGTVMSKTYGIAKKATAIGVKVLSDSGSGSTAGVIAGVDWTCKDHTAKRNKCVANMSLGGGLSSAMNQAVEDGVACGIQFAVASGNSNRDACSFSPASARGILSVNAMDSSDLESTFSNFGTCTDIYAPGSGITSTWIGSRFAINTISGTSMASPHVCGAMAIEAMTNDDPATMKSTIVRDATPNKIQRISPNSPNLLLYKDTCA